MLAPQPRTLIDACVLVVGPLRDLLLALDGVGALAAVWSSEIERERRWAEARFSAVSRPGARLLDRAPDPAAAPDPDAVAALTLSDPRDRHVLAAAIRCGAESLLTFNLRDFPPSLCARYGVTPVTPDRFLSTKIAPAALLAALEGLRLRLGAPVPNDAELAATLRRCRLRRMEKIFLSARSGAT